MVIPEEAPEEEEPENLIEISTGPPAGEPAVSAPVLVSPHPALRGWGAEWLGWGGGHCALLSRWWPISSIRPLDLPMAP